MIEVEVEGRAVTAVPAGSWWTKKGSAKMSGVVKKKRTGRWTVYDKGSN